MLMRQLSVWVMSSQRAGRLVPKRRSGLRAGVVVLRPGGIMEWHSTQEHEELLIAMTGRVVLEVLADSGRLRRVAVRAGQCAFLPRRVRHRVVNRSTASARYIYVTAPYQ